uniref:Uncharacterized protein n=1 Tax=Arundo donax TaxID=35708 RepID=A0A0A8YPZ5_ARUDO
MAMLLEQLWLRWIIEMQASLIKALDPSKQSREQHGLATRSKDNQNTTTPYLL